MCLCCIDWIMRNCKRSFKEAAANSSFNQFYRFKEFDYKLGSNHHNHPYFHVFCVNKNNVLSVSVQMHQNWEMYMYLKPRWANNTILKWTETSIIPLIPPKTNPLLKTLFNIVEDRFKRLLNFDVCVVWWCSDGPDLAWTKASTAVT